MNNQETKPLFLADTYDLLTSNGVPTRILKNTGGIASQPAAVTSERELVARVSLAAQVRRVCKARLSQRRSGSVSGLQQVECTGTAISFGEGYRVGHARGGHNYGDGAQLLMRGVRGL